jgi:hypothetical protein
MTHALLQLHVLSVAYALTLARNSLCYLTGQKPKERIRTPILRLTNEMRKLDPERGAAKDQRVWLT